MHNAGKSVVAERFIRTLKSKIYKYMSILMNQIVNKYNNTNHRTIKTRPVDVNPSSYIDFNNKM